MHACPGFDQPIGIAGCANGIVAIFDVYNGNILNVERLHNDDVRALAVISPSHFVTTSFDGTGGVWTVKNESSYVEFESVALLSGIHTDKILSISVTSTGSHIFTAGADGRVVLWRNESLKLI